MRLSFNATAKKTESIADIMAPIKAITDKLKTFRENALAEAEQADAEAEAAKLRAADLRDDANEAKRLAEKYA